jgi:hypothetical protein
MANLGGATLILCILPLRHRVTSVSFSPITARKLDRCFFSDFRLHAFRSAAFSVYISTLSCFLVPFGAFNCM